MGRGNPRAHRRANAQQGVQKKRIRISAVPIVIDGATGVGFGSAQIGDFPQGNIHFLSAVAYLSVVGAGGQAGLVDTWVGDFGIGTTPADDGTITAADVDIIPSTALAAATAEVSPRTRGASITATPIAILDNTDGSLEINANVLVDDASISADTMLATLEGELEIAYIVLGDD
jgi:hypothetical protein